MRHGHYVLDPRWTIVKYFRKKQLRNFVSIICDVNFSLCGSWYNEPLPCHGFLLVLTLFSPDSKMCLENKKGTKHSDSLLQPPPSGSDEDQKQQQAGRQRAHRNWDSSWSSDQHFSVPAAHANEGTVTVNWVIPFKHQKHQNRSFRKPWVVYLNWKRSQRELHICCTSHLTPLKLWGACSFCLQNRAVAALSEDKRRAQWEKLPHPVGLQ